MTLSGIPDATNGTNWLEVATDICLGRKPMPGISDAERAENLRDELMYAKRELQDAERELQDAQFKHSGAYAAYSQANYKYMAHLEMMAAGASK